MKNKLKLFLPIFILTLIVSVVSVAQRTNQTNKQNSTEMNDSLNVSYVEMKTTLGDILIMLYNDTPKHRDNFLKLVEEGFYDGVLFHRVIKDFMIQTGDPNSKTADADTPLGAGDPNYTIEAEFRYPTRYHKFGALAAARTGDQVNPERRSSGSQFYIVTGQKYTAGQLSQMNARMRDKMCQSYFRSLVLKNKDLITELQLKKDTAALDSLQQQYINETEAAVPESVMTPEIIEAYTTVGGTPHLDAEYTVFGEVVEGMNIVDSIQNVTTGRADRPVEDVRILSAKIVKK